MSALPVLVCGLVCLGGAPAWSLSDVVPAETVGQRTTGIYSDMAMNDASGDVVGIEIFVVYSRAGYYVVFQASEGEPEPPVVAAATIEGGRIAFHLPPGAGHSGVFRGEIRNGELTGAFEGGQIGSHGEKKIRLKRGSSYWQ